MITVCCVNVGNYEERGIEYVNKLCRAVRRNFTVRHNFVCFTDNNEGLECDSKSIQGRGWYSKLFLFKEFNEGRVIFFDLDTLIIRNIDFMSKFRGEFAILEDFGAFIDQFGAPVKRFHGKGFGSGVMMWEGGFGHGITDSYIADGEPEIIGGDQIYIESHVKKAKLIQKLYPEKMVSYKYDCYAGFPRKAAVCCFHGYPKPHDFSFGWVKDQWK